ncbi:hypothetical protein [Pseudooceanicola sp. MF1-13]|uniref:hypothetical protein n=1 Tax=Pseudooceanicola sp. MF1-13 TaxID=3379095 RepID=UPI003891B73C
MDRHLLIAGQGRSGSTLFYSMLQHALDGFAMPQVEMSATRVLPYAGNTCSKRPFDIFDMKAIVAAAEGRKKLDLIIMMRDPRDILTSVHSKVPDDYFCSADHCYFIGGPGAPTKTAPGFLMMHMATVEVLNSGLFPQGVFLLKYEHLIDDPARIQTMLAEALDLPFKADFTDFHKGQIGAAHQSAMNGVRPVSADRVQKWRSPQHRDRIIDQFTRFPVLHDILIDLGYEESTAWFDDYCADDQQLKAKA